jgi:N6-adenosine-specific RNA methylase IME4
MSKKYSVILADPPYKYDNAQTNDPKRGGIVYPTMLVSEMAKIPIHKCAADNSILIVWTTFPKLTDRKYDIDFFEMVRLWGFAPVTALFIWIKTNKRGEAIYEDTNLLEYDDYYSGLGRYSNSNAEVAFVARRGKGLERRAKNVKQLIFAPIGEHSAKPQEQYARIEALYGDVPRIELFARKQNPPPEGWDAVGLDWEPSIDIRDWIKAYD